MSKITFVPGSYRSKAGFRPVLRMRRNGLMCGTVTLSSQRYETAELAESVGRIAALKYALRVAGTIAVDVR